MLCDVCKNEGPEGNFPRCPYCGFPYPADNQGVCNICQAKHPEGEECPRCPFCGAFAHPPKAGWKFGTCPRIMAGKLPRMGRLSRPVAERPVAHHASRPRFRKG